jgi:exportin-7
LYRERYKPLAACLACVREALAGGYVNFGVLQLYGDPCLTVLLDTTLGLVLSVPTEHALAYPKLAKPYFALLEALFASHLPFLAAKDQATFSRLLEVLYAGLQALEAPMSTHASYAMDHLASYLFAHRDAPAGSPGSVDADATLLLRDHCAANPRLFPDLTAKLFEQLLFGPYASHWAVREDETLPLDNALLPPPPIFFALLS